MGTSYIDLTSLSSRDGSTLGTIGYNRTLFGFTRFGSWSSRLGLVIYSTRGGGVTIYYPFYMIAQVMNTFAIGFSRYLYDLFKGFVMTRYGATSLGRGLTRGSS